MTTYLKGIKINIDKKTAYTNSNGVAIINKVSIGLQRLNITKSGYMPISTQMNIPNEVEKTLSLTTINNSYQINVEPSTAQINLKRTGVDGKIYEAQYIGHTPVINGSFGDFVEYEIVNQNYDTIVGSFYLRNPQQNGSNSKSFEMSLSKGTLNLYVRDIDGNGVSGATVNINNKTYLTDINGLVSIANLIYGSYQFSVTGENLRPYSSVVQVESSINNDYITVTEVNAYAFKTFDDSISEGDDVIINNGMATSNLKMSAYLTTDNTMINDLSLTGVVSQVNGDVITLEQQPSNNAQINVISDQDDCNIEFNNDNEIKSVEINVIAKDLYLAFTQSDKTIYFKNNTLPFIPSDNTFESKSYTYYTYENNLMVSHSATTSSVTVGTNTYDGTILKLNTSDSFSDGNWNRDNSKDIEIDDENTNIETSTYLTTPNPIIPTDSYFKFAPAKLNKQQWDTTLLIGGQEKSFINYQEFTVKSNQLIEIYYKKHNSNNMVDATGKQFYISQDKIYRKLNYIITSNVSGSTIKFTVNGIKFEYLGSTANIDLYEGDTVNWEVSAEGYTTQSGSYTVASYPTISSYTNTVTLVQA